MHVTLDGIRQVAEQKFGDYSIDLGDGATLVLRNALRLDKDARRALTELQSRIAAEMDAEVQDLDVMVGSIRDALRLLAADRRDADRLIELVGDDLPVLLEVFNGYQEAAQPGEASSSVS